MTTMDMNGASSNTTMAGSVNIAPMYFTTWDQFQLHLLFLGWDIKQPWQFALTWFAVAFAVAMYHYLECIAFCMRKAMGKTLIELEGTVVNNADGFINRPSRPNGWPTIKLMFGTLMGMKFCLGLFLMLIAMTFNPSLFLAIFVGYIVGQYTVCDFQIDLDSNVKVTLSEPNGILGYIIQKALCIPHFATGYTAVPNPEYKNDTFFIIMKYVLWTLPRLISAIFLVVMMIWVKKVEGGFGFEEASVFGWHALCMSLFIVVFTNEAVLTYAAPFFPQLSNAPSMQKVFHSSMHILGLTSWILGLIAIIDYKLWSDSPTAFPFFTMYTVHSWLGVCTLGLWGLQLLFGLFTFTLAKTFSSDASKVLLKQIHQFSGHCVYALGLATCATGFQDMQSSDLAGTYMASDASSNMTTTMDMSMMPTDDLTLGYKYNSTWAQQAAAAAVLLFSLGVSTFAAVKFSPFIKSVSENNRPSSGSEQSSTAIVGTQEAVL